MLRAISEEGRVEEIADEGTRRGGAVQREKVGEPPTVTACGITVFVDAAPMPLSLVFRPIALRWLRIQF